jgi:histidine triad (HIT) family protein
VIHEDDLIYVFLAPASLGGVEGHTLVATKRHVETIFDLNEEEEVALGRAVPRAARMLRAGFDLDGVLVQQHNGAAAFQTVPHVHWHVIPAREGFTWPPEREIPIRPWQDRAKEADRLRKLW